MTEPWVIAILSNAALLLCSLWAISIRMTWKAGQTKAEILEAINHHARDDEAEYSAIRQEIYKATHDFGETIMALKEHTNGIQLEAARLYVRRDGFQDAIKQLMEGINVLRVEFRADLQRMEQKIDQKT